MKFKSCLTCEHFKQNVVQELVNKQRYDTKVLQYDANWCYHELSKGELTSRDMIYHGACGRDMKLWSRKGSLIDELEIRESD